MRRIYISGPISGIVDFRKKFEAAELALKYTGNWEDVVNPVNVGDSIDFPEVISEEDRYPVYMREDLKELLTCTHIYVLDGWAYSVGALIEIVVAKICGLHFLYQTPKKHAPSWVPLLKFLLKATAKKGMK
jgi:hypothetical protein